MLIAVMHKRLRRCSTAIEVSPGDEQEIQLTKEGEWLPRAGPGSYPSILAFWRVSRMNSVRPHVGLKMTRRPDAATERSASTPNATFVLSACLRFSGSSRARTPTSEWISCKKH